MVVKTFLIRCKWLCIKHSSKNKFLFDLHLLDFCSLIKPLSDCNCLSLFLDKQLLQMNQSESDEALSDNTTTKVRNTKVELS